MAEEPTLVRSPGAVPAGAEGAAADAKVVFGQVMFLVAANLGFLAAGAWIGRDLSGGWALACFIGAIVLTLALGFARRSTGLGMGILFAMGLLMGLGLGPGLAAYASLDGGPQLIAQAAGLTALFIGGLGAYGYATRRDFSSWGRYLFWALLGLIAVGIVFIFVSIPGENILWSLLGLGVFGFYTVFDFNRLKRASQDDVVFIACSIFLDVVNVFLFMLQLLGGSRD